MILDSTSRLSSSTLRRRRKGPILELRGGKHFRNLWVDAMMVYWRCWLGDNSDLLLMGGVEGRFSGDVSFVCKMKAWSFSLQMYH